MSKNLKIILINLFVTFIVSMFTANYMILNIFESGKIFKSGELLEMQIVDTLDPSWERRPLINFWNKVFFSIPSNSSGYNQEHLEFLEFRENNSPENFDLPGSGVAGAGIFHFNDFYDNFYRYSKQSRSSSESFVIWSENGRDIRFTTQSDSESDFGSLGTSRLILHSSDGNKTPISMVNSYLQFPGKDRDGVKFFPNDDGTLEIFYQDKTVFKIDQNGNLVLPVLELDFVKCSSDEHVGRIVFDGKSLHTCTYSGWSN